MRVLAIIAALSSLTLAVAQAVTGALGDAPVSTNNPAGVSYQAVFPDKNTTSVRGYVTGTSNSNGTGVTFNVNIYGLPDETIYGPFIYHIHALPVPSDGNCSGTLAHLDPFVRGEKPPCDPTQPQTCQVGDLSGKHGNITTPTSFQASYLELYTSTEEGVGSFFGNRSIVVHTNNKTRLNCANFSLVAGTQPSSGGSGSVSTPTSPPPAQFTGSAAVKTVSLGAVVLGLAAAVML